MNISVFGTGVVGRTIARKLNEVGHDIMIGTRNVAATMARSEPGSYGMPPLSAWLQGNPSIALGTFAEASAYGEVAINAINGAGAVDAIGIGGRSNLEGKILIDLANPLDFSNGFPPSLFVCNTDSLGEQIQRAFPKTRVVKTLNIVNCNVMVDPGAVAGGDHTMLLCGDDPDARSAVSGYLKQWFGWKDVVDLGDLAAARGMEMMLPIWIRMYGALKTAVFSFKVAR